MTYLLSAALEVHPDEFSFLLSEVNLLSPDKKSRRRFQIIYVNRNDRLAEYREDLGLAESFTADQFRIPGGVHNEETGRYELLHTVGELRDIAEMLRNSPSPVEVEPADLWQRLFDEVDVAQREQEAVSAFGPLVKVERN